VPEPHEVLGVAPDASPEQIREAFKVLARIFHPDRLAEAPLEVQAEAGRRMAEMNVAYQALMDFAAMDVVYETEGGPIDSGLN
jgi:curved DNA-binding protein CbpA